MFGRRKQVSTRIDTLLGKTSTLNGDLDFSGGLHLDGRVNGNVRSTAPDGGALSVSESGFIEGRVEVTNIVMNGTVNGDMHARERLVLGEKARVNGNVYYGVIEMAPGAVITGKLIPLAKGAMPEAPSKPVASSMPAAPAVGATTPPKPADPAAKVAPAKSTA